MNCQKIKKLLNPYIDKTLDVNTAKQINEHLKSCAACREEHLKLKKIISTLNSISTQTAFRTPHSPLVQGLQPG